MVEFVCFYNLLKKKRLSLTTADLFYGPLRWMYINTFLLFHFHIGWTRWSKFV